MSTESTTNEPSAMPCSAFRVKLLQLWTFPGLTSSDPKWDWNGIWETMSAYGIGSENESFDLRRAAVTKEGQKLNEVMGKIPVWLILKCGHCHTLKPIYTPNGMDEGLRRSAPANTTNDL